MRNPFHDYKEYEEVLYKVNRIRSAMETQSEIIPYQKNISNTNVRLVYRRGDCSFNCSKGKSDFNGNPYPTAEYVGEFETYLKREKAKFRKDGSLIVRTSYNPTYDDSAKEWVYECYSPIFCPITDDIQILLEVYKDYRQISSGKNHRERQIIVADVDEDFTQNTINILESICTEKKIPHFTYLEHHLDSNHYQFGWILDRPFRVINEYNRPTAEYRQYLNLIIVFLFFLCRWKNSI